MSSFDDELTDFFKFSDAKIHFSNGTLILSKSDCGVY